MQLDFIHKCNVFVVKWNRSKLNTYSKLTTAYYFLHSCKCYLHFALRLLQDYKLSRYHPISFWDKATFSPDLQNLVTAFRNNQVNS